MKNHTKKPSELQKNGRFSVLNKKIRIAALAATSAAVAIILAITVFDATSDVLALTRHDSNKQKITVSELSELPNARAESGIIDHPRLFSVYMSVAGKELKRQTASVSPDMDYRALLAAFTAPPEVKTVRITIPKSASVSDIIDIFVSHGIGSREGFTNTINEYPFEYDFIGAIPNDTNRRYRLEGYLYPDTYDFYTERSESYYINKLLERFEKAATEIVSLCQKNETTLDRVLTVASLIECSAGFSSSYERVSSVIHNRLDSDTPLELPASLIYGINSKGGLFVGLPEDSLKSLDSPYNTFKNKGLPPSPVCNPTKEAMLCALYPEESKYFYFVTQKNGKVLFAKTLAEHRQNITLTLED